MNNVFALMFVLSENFAIEIFVDCKNFFRVIKIPLIFCFCCPNVLTQIKRKNKGVEKMFTNTDAEKFDRESIIVYGKSGTGKTSLSKTVPGKPLIINAENGLKSIKGSHIPVYDITVDKDGNLLDRKFRFEKLLHLLHLLNEAEYKEKYDWLIFDSLTEISQCYVEFLKSKYPDKKDALVLWGEYNDGIQGFIKQLRDFAPYNILLLALESYDKDEHGRRYIGIDINGTKAPQRLPALFDECYQLKIFTNDEGVQKRFLVTREYENNVAKTRSSDLEHFEDANIKTIIEKQNSKEKTNV